MEQPRIGRRVVVGAAVQADNNDVGLGPGALERRAHAGRIPPGDPGRARAGMRPLAGVVEREEGDPEAVDRDEVRPVGRGEVGARADRSEPRGRQRARIVSGTVPRPASPAWLFAIAIASNPAAARIRAEAGRASRAFGPVRPEVRPARERRLEVPDGEVGRSELDVDPGEDPVRVGCGQVRDPAAEHHVAGEEELDGRRGSSGRGTGGPCPWR